MGGGHSCLDRWVFDPRFLPTVIVPTLPKKSPVLLYSTNVFFYIDLILFLSISFFLGELGTGCAHTWHSYVY